MSYHHQFTGRTEGIHPTAPVRWRGLHGLISAFWEAEGEAGGRGYYVSANPRISIFFTDVSSIRVAVATGAPRAAGRPMSRAFFVPAGMPIWTAFTSPLAFSHLDIHLNADRALAFLAPALGRAAATEALGRPAEVEDPRDLEALARLLVEEVTTPARHDLYAESLAGGLVAGVLDLDGAAGAAGAGPGSGAGARPPREAPLLDAPRRDASRPDASRPEGHRPDGRLTGAQMRRIVARFEAGGGRRLTVSEMAEAVGLSDSWFSTVFRNTTGTTPLQWQSRRRIDLALSMLGDGGLSIAEVADRLGFSDQAHFTRVFRQVAGETPAAWRRARLAE